MLITKKIKFSASRVTNMMGSDDDRPITEFGTTLRRGRLFVGEAPIATYFGFPGPSLVNNSDLIERNVRPKGCCTYVHCMSLLLSYIFILRGNGNGKRQQPFCFSSTLPLDTSFGYFSCRSDIRRKRLFICS